MSDEKMRKIKEKLNKSRKNRKKEIKREKKRKIGKRKKYLENQEIFLVLFLNKESGPPRKFVKFPRILRGLLFRLYN